MTFALGGFAEAGFEGVADAFARNFDDHCEVGAAFCLHVEGRPVVDVWAGVADFETATPYAEDTLQLVFSATKGATAACANLLVQRGALDLDEPVATYWPEFATAGKEDISVRMVLAHQSAIPTIDAKLSLEDVLRWDPVITALEDQAPMWEPGRVHGYHAVTFGHLVGELVRRIDGRSLGTYFAEEIAGPLGLEFWIGLPEEHEHRVAPILGDLVPLEAANPMMRNVIEGFLSPESLLGRALSLNGAFPDTLVMNRRDVHAAEIPAGNGITSARSLSRFYAGLIGRLEGAEGTPLFTVDQMEAARQRQTVRNDRCLIMETCFGLGFMNSCWYSPYGSAGSFGHTGAGGAVGFADPENQLGFGYVMNHMRQHLAGDPRTKKLVGACYEAVGAPAKYV